MNEPYRKALRDSNVSSATWNCVGCIDDPSAVEKLQIIKSCLIDVKVYSRLEMVLCRYVGGLRKSVQYSILELIGLSKKEAMEQVRDLPF